MTKVGFFYSLFYPLIWALGDKEKADKTEPIKEKEELTTPTVGAFTIPTDGIKRIIIQETGRNTIIDYQGIVFDDDNLIDVTPIENQRLIGG
jgi:hypothetical protein